MLQWTWECTYLIKLMFSLSLDKYSDVELLGRTVVLYNFVRDLHTVFPRDYTDLHSHQQYTRVPFLLHPYQHLSFLIFLITTILISMRWYLSVVLICISLMISDVEHFFMYLLVTCVSLGKKSVHISHPFFNQIVCFFFFFFAVELYEFFIYIWISVPYQVHDLQIYFPIW